MPFWNKKHKYPADCADKLKGLVNAGNYAGLNQFLTTEGYGYLASQSIQTHLGEILLESAARHGRLEIMQLLIFHGIQAEFLRDKNGSYRVWTPGIEIKDPACTQLLIKAADNFHRQANKKIMFYFILGLLLGIGLVAATYTLGPIFVAPLLLPHISQYSLLLLYDLAASLGFVIGLMGSLLVGVSLFPPKLNVKEVLGTEFTPKENDPTRTLFNTQTPVGLEPDLRAAALSLSAKGVLEPASVATKNDSTQPLLPNGQIQQLML